MSKAPRDRGASPWPQHWQPPFLPSVLRIPGATVETGLIPLLPGGISLPCDPTSALAWLSFTPTPIPSVTLQVVLREAEREETSCRQVLFPSALQESPPLHTQN